MTCGKVIARSVMQRSNNREFVCAFGLQGKQFTNFDSLDIGPDWIPDSAVLCRCLRLQVVQVQVTWATVQPK